MRRFKFQGSFPRKILLTLLVLFVISLFVWTVTEYSLMRNTLMQQKIIDLDPSGYVLCNGAYAELNGLTVHEVFFSKEAVSKIREITLKYNGFYIMETLEHMYVDSLTSDSFSAFMSGWGRVLEGFREDESANLRYMIAMIGFMDKETLHIASKELAPYVKAKSV